MIHAKSLVSRKANLQNRVLEKEDFKPLLSAFPCWCTTTYAISNSLPLKPAMFDVAIIDEASQCDIASCIPILFRCKKAIIVADNKQLPHLSFLEKAKEQSFLSQYDIDDRYQLMWRYRDNSMFDLANYYSTTPVLLDEHLREILASKGGSMSVEEFKKAVLGNKNIDLSKLNSITFEKGELSFFENLLNKIKTTKIEPLQVAKVSDIEKEFLNEPKLLERIRAMSKLQPLRQGEAVITKQQIIDAMNECKINDPKFLDKVFSAFTNKASKDELKFVSNKSLYDLKGLMEDYIEALCKDAKDGNITEDIIKKAKSKNMAFNTINFISGFVFAAVFLSTLIPKFQYWVTKQKTGKEGFPGMYEYEQKQSA